MAFAGELTHQPSCHTGRALPRVFALLCVSCLPRTHPARRIRRRGGIGSASDAQIGDRVDRWDRNYPLTAGSTGLLTA